MLSDLPKTWLVVPCYNEGRRLALGAFQNLLDRYPTVKLCLVNDGSRDNTAELLREFAAANQRQAVSLNLACNSGKAEAVRRGVLHAVSLDPAEYVGYWDADLATPLEELPRFFAAAAEYQDVAVLCGCRLQRLGALVERRWLRHFLGRLFATIASMVLRLPTYDTQCGAKLFRTELVRQAFAAPFLTRWCFDVELLARVMALESPPRAAECIVEVPLRRWRDVGGSKLRLRDCLTTAWDLLRIFRHYRRWHPSAPALDTQPMLAVSSPAAAQGTHFGQLPEQDLARPKQNLEKAA